MIEIIIYLFYKHLSTRVLYELLIFNKNNLFHQLFTCISLSIYRTNDLNFNDTFLIFAITFHIGIKSYFLNCLMSLRFTHIDCF